MLLLPQHSATPSCCNVDCQCKNTIEKHGLTYYDKNSNGNTINIENDIDDVKSIELTLKFNQGNQDLLLQGKVAPYNLRLGRAMSYHE